MPKNVKEYSIFKKYPEIGYLEENLDILNSCELLVFEKIDGANTHFRTINGRLRCGSRGDWIDKKRQKPLWASAFESWVYRNPKHAAIPARFITYGEWYGFNNIFYRPEYLNSFFLIDIYDIESGKFLDYSSAKEIILTADIDDIIFLPLLKKGKISMEELKMLLEKSDYYDGPREGVVIKDYKNQKFAKLLHPVFQDFRKDQNRPLLENYVTEIRIEKIIEELWNAGKMIEMGGVVRRLKEDIKKNHKIVVREDLLGVKVKFYLDRYSSFLDEIQSRLYSTKERGFVFANLERKKELLEKYFPDRFENICSLQPQAIEEKSKQILEIASRIKGCHKKT
ncbi:MAG: RNA ligase family protein [Candidatus Pacearchaeota archaeon]